MGKISKAFEDVNKSTALIRREGAFPLLRVSLSKE